MSDARLMAALGASAAPARDPRFALAVIEAAEADRFRLATIRAMLRSAGVTVACAALALPLAGWAVANVEALENGLLAGAGFLVLAAGARGLAQRATAGLRR